jgi:hypothetical protein
LTPSLCVSPVDKIKNSFENVNFKNTKQAIDINIERSLLIKELEKVEDISLLKAIKALLNTAPTDEGKISIEQYNRELDEAEASIDAGDFFTQEEVEKMAKDW